MAALKGIPINKDSFRGEWQRLTRRCGLSHIWPHDLRRTVATNLYRETHDLRAVQQYLGHSRIDSTTHYLAPLDDDQLREYHALLNFREFDSEVKQ
jgi:integrase